MKYINYLIIFGAKPSVLLKNHIHSKPSLGFIRDSECDERGQDCIYITTHTS